MAAIAKIVEPGELQERKRELVIASELNRRALAFEADNLAPLTSRVETGYAWARVVLPWWKLASPAIGLLLVRRRRVRPTRRLLAKALLAVQLVRKLPGLWRRVRSACC